MTIDVQTLLNESTARHKVPGAALAVLSGGEVREAATGVVSKATGVEATTDAVFQIGSITKVYTATLIMQLVDHGKLAVDDPVRTVLPEFRVARSRGLERSHRSPSADAHERHRR